MRTCLLMLLLLSGSQVRAQTPTTFSSQEDARQAAVRKYPDLAIAGSPFNLAFVALYKSYLSQRPEYFRAPSWPMRLADEVATTRTATDPETFLGLTENELIQRLGAPADVVEKTVEGAPVRTLFYDTQKGTETFFVIPKDSRIVCLGSYHGKYFALPAK